MNNNFSQYYQPAMQALGSKTITQLENRSSNYLSTRVVVTAIKCYAFEKSKTLKYHRFTTGFFLTSTTLRRSHITNLWVY